MIEVSAAAQLKSALTAAAPGDTIRCADGTYTGGFKAARAATSGARITLTGSPKAVLTAGGGYGLHLIKNSRVHDREGTTGARIVGNTFDGRGLTGAHHDDSWGDVKGDDVLVENNTGKNTPNDSSGCRTTRRRHPEGSYCFLYSKGHKSHGVFHVPQAPHRRR